MKITCPDCNQSYNFDERKIPKNVNSAKCKACGAKIPFGQGAETHETPPETPDAPPPLPAEKPPSAPVKKAEQTLPAVLKKGDLSFEYLHEGVFTLLKINLTADQKIKAESDAMVAMSPNIRIKGKMEGGLLRALGRLLTGEKFFFQTIHAEHGPGEVYLAHAIPGEITDIELDGRTSYILQKDGFFAGDENLVVTTKMQNLAKGILSGEGFFIIRVSGKGVLFVSSYGAIHPVDLEAGEEIIVDNHHLVAWPETMNYTIEKAASGWISSLTSGEGFVTRFRGPGRILIQTRNPRSFGGWMKQFIPRRGG